MTMNVEIKVNYMDKNLIEKITYALKKSCGEHTCSNCPFRMSNDKCELVEITKELKELVT